MTDQPAAQPAAQSTPPFLHNASIAMAILCPIAMLLPPRKMDIRFALLSAGFSYSTSQLVYDYTGKSIYERVGSRFQSAMPTELPDRARQVQEKIRLEKMQRDGLTEEDMRRIETGKRNAISRLWYGTEGEDWKTKREERERKAFEEGKGVSDLISDQIAEVWKGKEEKNAAKKAGDDGKTS